jgi:hypothetical protein
MISFIHFIYGIIAAFFQRESLNLVESHKLNSPQQIHHTGATQTVH